MAGKRRDVTRVSSATTVDRRDQRREVEVIRAYYGTSLEGARSILSSGFPFEDRGFGYGGYFSTNAEYPYDLQVSCIFYIHIYIFF